MLQMLFLPKIQSRFSSSRHSSSIWPKTSGFSVRTLTRSWGSKSPPVHLILSCPSSLPTWWSKVLSYFINHQMNVTDISNSQHQYRTARFVLCSVQCGTKTKTSVSGDIMMMSFTLESSEECKQWRTILMSASSCVDLSSSNSSVIVSMPSWNLRQ